MFPSLGSRPRLGGPWEGENVLRVESKFLKALAGFLLLGTLLFNVADASLTLWVVAEGIAVEANPLLQGPMETGPLAFIAVKSGLAGGGVYLMWRRRDHLIVVTGAYVCFVVYWSLVLWFWLSL